VPIKREMNIRTKFAMGICKVLRRYMTKGKEDACKKKNKDKYGNAIKTNSKKETAERLFGIRRNKEKYCSSKND
jgi:hypothetical protein